MEESIDAQQQYSRGNYLLHHGTEETKGEQTDNIVLEVLNNEMDLNISKTALDHSHRIGNPKSQKSYYQSLSNLFDIMIEETYLWIKSA